MTAADGSPPPECAVAVIGAGVVGLACAAALAAAGRRVVVLERNAGIAREVSSRNSEVIHAGLYYPPGSWKARLCARGRELLYERCRAHRIAHRAVGKLVVAAEQAEVPALERLAATARANGVPGLEVVDAARVRELEPGVRAVAALESPRSGIVDAHALALSFLAEAESHGAALVLRAEVMAVEPGADRQRLVVKDADGERTSLECAAVVNAAGLASDRIAAQAGVDVEARGWRIHYSKGDYFALAPGAPLRVERLVYPLPTAGGPLGIHATVDLGGRIRFGPDAACVDRPHYDVDPAKAAIFADAVSHYLPGLRADWLTPDYAGVRPRITPPGAPPRDFVIEAVGAWVHLVGIESPGLTAAPAIAERVLDLLEGV